MVKMMSISCLAFVVISMSPCVNAEGRLSDLVARFKSSEETTKPSGLDSLLDSYDLDREGTHKKSWMKLDGHHHRKSLSSLLDEFYPEVSTEGPKTDSDKSSDSHSPDDFDSVPTQGPFDSVPHRVHHQHSKDIKKGRRVHEGNHERRTTPGPISEPDQGEISGEGRKWSEEPTVPTRHHHRYHRGDGLSPHQPQADSTFSQPSVSGYYDYSASSGNGSPAMKNTRLSNTDWRKALKKQDKTRWSSSGASTVLIGTVPRNDGQSDEYLVRQHLQSTKNMGCRIPQPKIIRIADHYPSASKLYFPQCTRLHQCSQDTGCCPIDKKCGPKTTHRVELYFYTTTLLSRPSGSEGKHMPIEKLPFYNHTECECQDRTDEMPRDNDRISSNSVDSIYNLETTDRQVCLCPSAFTLKFLPNGSCACDCFDKQKECTKYKRGKEFFIHKDKLCIAANKCVVPMCDYGTYNRRYGRCPRKHERHKNSWSRFN